MIDGRNKYLYPPKSNILSNIDVNAFLRRCLNGDQPLFFRSVSNKVIRQSMSKDRNLIFESKLEIDKSETVTDSNISDDESIVDSIKLHAHYVNGSHLHRMMRSKKLANLNIVVLYYAPWDTRCERFTPQYEKVAEYFHAKLEDDGNEDGKVLKSNVLLLKIDATANDIPEGIALYPRIYLYRSDTQSSKIGHGIRFRNKRKTKKVISWILEMCDFFDEDTEENDDIMEQKWLKRKNILAQEKRDARKGASGVNIQVIKDGEEEVTRVEMESELDLYSDLVDYYYFDGDEEYDDDDYKGEKDDEEFDDKFEYV